MTGLSGKVRTGRCWTDQNFSPSGSPKLAGDGLISEPDSAHWIFLKGQYWLLLTILVPRYHRNLDYVAYISISGELLVEEVGQVSLPESSNGTSSAFTSQGSLLCLLQGWISTCHPFCLGWVFLFFKFSLREISRELDWQESSTCGWQKSESVQTQRWTTFTLSSLKYPQTVLTWTFFNFGHISP